MKIRDVLKVLTEDGLVVVRTRGSHRQLKHPVKRGLVTVAGHESKELSQATLRSVWRQAQIGGKS